VALLNVLGSPPDSGSLAAELPQVSWEASPNGLPPPALAGDAAGGPAPRHWATG
jgi:hypothetical protein